MRQQVRHWWNRYWNAGSRQDIKVWRDGSRWAVELRRGGSEGKSQWVEVADEAAALSKVAELMEDESRWRDLSSLYESRPQY